MAAVIGYEPNSLAATLYGYHRFKVVNQVYPGIIEVSDASSAVEGLVYSHLSEEDMAKLDLFEGDFYSTMQVSVKLLNDTQLNAHTYVWSGDIDNLIGTWSFEEDFLPNESKFLREEIDDL